MKTTTLVLFLSFIVQVVFSQDLDHCRMVVQLTTEAINSQSTAAFETHLAVDFEIAGHKGPVGKQIVNQLLSQLGDEVESFEEVSYEFLDKTLILTYLLKYAERGSKETSFVFNKQNQLIGLELFSIQVKTLKKEDTKVEKPKDEIICIPFFMIGELIAVSVELDQKERIFLFDSGSPRVILNKKYVVKKDTLTKTTISSSKGVGGAVSGLDIETLEQLNFGGLKMKNQRVLTLDLSQLEQKEPEIEIHGIIGYEFFEGYDLLIDYKNKKLTLILPKAYEQFKKKHFSNAKLTRIPFQLSGHIPVIQAQIGKKEYALGIDTGAETNLMADGFFKSFSKHLKKIDIDTLTGLDNNRIHVKSGILKMLKFKEKGFKNLKTVFSDLTHLNKDKEIKIDGLIGFEILSKQMTLIRYGQKELVLIE